MKYHQYREDLESVIIRAHADYEVDKETPAGDLKFKELYTLLENYLRIFLISREIVPIAKTMFSPGDLKELCAGHPENDAVQYNFKRLTITHHDHRNNKATTSRGKAGN